jgi:hypothetical protein
VEGCGNTSGSENISKGVEVKRFLKMLSSIRNMGYILVSALRRLYIC